MSIVTGSFFLNLKLMASVLVIALPISALPLSLFEGLTPRNLMGEASCVLSENEGFLLESFVYNDTIADWFLFLKWSMAGKTGSSS